jgi:GLPGLI family protein
MRAAPIPLTLINIKPRCINLFLFEAAIVLKQIKMHMNVKYFMAGLLLIVQTARAQQQTGRVVYEFTPQMKMQRAGHEGMGQAPPPPPRVPVFKLEVLFSNNQMLRQALEDNTINDVPGNENGVQIRGFGMADDITWLNFTEGRKVEQREFATKQYLITDTIRRENWKLTGETRNILGYTCQQAITTKIGKRSMVSMENGVMSRKEIPDTSHVIAWFTAAIPVPAGPDYAGQLPGLILQIDINGNAIYKAIEVSQKVDVASIKEPKKGKKVTAAEFNKERDKVMEEMQRNGGGRKVMHISN